MLNAVALAINSGWTDIVTGGIMNENEPKETPSPSPVPNWDEGCEYHYKWVDVTQPFSEACEGLKLGELVHEPNFGLYEAMSAIEMMDPKMDAGMLGGQAKRQVSSFKERIAEGSIKLNNLIPCELISVMDVCQTCILSWLEGQSLAQTVFTCLYLHETDLIQDRILKAYCIGVLKLCHLIKEKVFKANVFEEEDFQTLTYGFKFANSLTQMRVLGSDLETVLVCKDPRSAEITSSTAELQKMYCNDIVARNLPTEIEQFYHYKLSHNISATTVEKTSELFARHENLSILLPNLAVILRLYLTLPCTTCEAERSFSVLRRIKTYLRSTMSQKRLNHMFILNVYKQKVDSLDTTPIIDEWIGRSAIQQVFKSQQNKSDDATSLQAVLARLKFLRLFIQLLAPFGDKEKEVLQANRKLFNQLSEQLDIIDKTTGLGLPTTTSEDGHEISFGFEPLVNQRLLPPTFPRYTKLRSKDEISSCYKDMISRLLSVIDMTTLTSFQSILDFVVDFSHTEPTVLARSIVQITFIPEYRKIFGNQQLGEALRDSVRVFNSPPSLSNKFPSVLHHPQVRSCLDAFLTKASRAMGKMVQAYGHNYARQREKLSAVLEELGMLQDEADKCDQDINSLMHAIDPNAGKSHLTCIGSWTLYHTLRVMIQYVLSGFHLQLYSDHEYHYIYWYLAEVLLSWQLTTLNRAESQLQSDDMLADPTPAKSRSNKKSKKNKKKCKVHLREIAITQGMQMMAAGCFKALLGFFLEGKMSTPDFSFDDEGIRYEHRFSPFITVGTPPFVPYKQFQLNILQEMTNVSQYYPPPTAQDLYLSSSKHFTQAKQSYESVAPSAEVQKLLLVAKTNLVMTKLLAGGHKQNSTSRPQFDFSVNSVFPIIRVS
uniref:N-alpha-acetyltransferase 35, NatC auxiliary subunit-like n=1 Tax=Ciona intestinalis TaxID=7719 RepID=UPI000EF44B25|nr:N-alpha-acetyltransferase 35, NatC auxiliary subunit-like [Ciona intestinalis]|eukprot:XP_026692258.1 N-alpha-acetyltransferase 35, NatC auxiliary subunit-like [Ciona intestinalis]